MRRRDFRCAERIPPRKRRHNGEGARRRAYRALHTGETVYLTGQAELV
jgi:hypothetical protein